MHYAAVRMLASGIFTIGALLLVASGAAKIVDPKPTQGALAAMKLPSGFFLVLALGVVEFGAGLGALVAPGSVAPVVAVLYLGFTVFVAMAMRRGVAIQSCGCFGRRDTPPSLAHLVANPVIALTSLIVTGTRPEGLVDTTMRAPIEGTVYLGFSVMGAWLVYLLLAELPKTMAAMGDAE